MLILQKEGTLENEPDKVWKMAAKCAYAFNLI